jgi:PAS domain-containing protein
MASSSSDRGTAADERFQFETLISDLSARLMAQGPDQVDAEIAAALDRVRTFFDADRCGLLTFGVSPARSFVQYASYGPGVALLAGDFNLAEAFPWAYRTLLEQKPVIVYRLDELPAEAAADRASWELTATRSNLTLPVAVGSSLLHAIAMNWVHQERRFPDAYIPRLRVLGEVILSAVQRKEAFEALRTTQERLDRAAAAAGCGLWELDVSTGQIWVTSETRRLYGLTAEEDVI